MSGVELTDQLYSIPGRKRTLGIARTVLVQSGFTIAADEKMHGVRYLGLKLLRALLILV